MEVKKYYLTRSDNTRRMEKIEEVKYIVITSSSFCGASGLKNRNIIERLKYKQDREFSCHYIIDLYGSVLNIIPEDEIAICTGDLSVDGKSISIMLTNDYLGQYTKIQMNKMTKLIYEISKKYNVDKENIILEKDVNGSRRPKLFCDEEILLYDLVKNKR